MDNDCPADLICEDGACVAPPPATAPSSVAEPAAAAPTATPRQPRPAVATPQTPQARPGEEEVPRMRPRGKRHSSSMMVGGIVLTSLSAIPFTVAMLGTVSCGENVCDGASYFFGGMAVTAVLLGVGIPMITIGAKREPGSAKLAPWIAPHAAGFGLALDL